jgi:hypothetical protein
MINAGACVLSESAIDLAEGFVSPSEVAEAVFLAMLEVQEADAAVQPRRFEQ